MLMLYGTDYRSASDQQDARLLRRYRRDVMFVAAQPQEVVAAGLLAGLAVIPILLVASGIVAFLFSITFSGPAVVDGPSSGTSIAGLQVTPTSRLDFVLVLAALILTLAVAGGLTATLRRYDYLRRGGLQFYLHHPRSTLGLAGFFVPVTLVVVIGLLVKAAQARQVAQSQVLVAAPSLVDRGVLYVFMGILVSMLLYLIWESCFPLILPTLSNLDVDAEVGRLQRADRARIQAEEERVRRRSLSELTTGGLVGSNTDAPPDAPASRLPIPAPRWQGSDQGPHAR